MKFYKIDNIIFKYFLCLSFFIIFYLNFKHNVENDSSISEWLINYQGGFTRRGLGGEIAINIALFFGSSLRESIFYLQSFFHLSYLLLLYFFIKEIKFSILQLFAFFSPIFLLYPVAEIEVLGRKEILLFFFFISIIFFSEKKFKPKIINGITFVIMPLVLLIWEMVILFLPFIAAILVIKNNIQTYSKALQKLFFIFLPSIITFIFIYFFPLSQEGHKIMCDFLKASFDERCYMSANMLMTHTIYFDTFADLHKNTNFVHIVRYILIFIIGFMPLNILLRNNIFLKKNNLIFNNFKLHTLFFMLYSPSILLFIFAYDWGRWINITYSFSILFYLFLYKNKMISNYDLNKIKIISLLNNKKKISIFLLVIFAFSWTPKTVVTGDIGSFPGYRIPVKAIKFYKHLNKY